VSAQAGATPATRPPAAAYEVTGPSAFTGDFSRFVHLTRILAVTEWKLRFFDSALGYVWTLMRPALFFGVLYVVFSLIVDVGENVAHYPALLLTGMVLYFFFQEATSKAVTAVVDNENLVRKIHFPRMAIPMSVVLTATFALALNLIVLLGLVLINRVTPRISWFELPLILIVLCIFTVGVSAILSALYVRARDLNPIWDVTTQALFYLTPVLYPIQLVVERSSETVAHLLMLNPLATLIQEARHAIVGPTQPSAAEAIGGAPMLLIPLGIVLATFVVGIWLFSRMAPKIAEEL
jgi:ABC-2 type transport system permease protein